MGSHYWMLDVQMDCSKTVDGWFEFKAYTSTVGWESNVRQQGAPYITGNHFARCGMINTFLLNESKAEFEPF
jgi:alpha-amylase